MSNGPCKSGPSVPTTYFTYPRTIIAAYVEDASQAEAFQQGIKSRLDGVSAGFVEPVVWIADDAVRASIREEHETEKLPFIATHAVSEEPERTKMRRAHVTEPIEKITRYFRSHVAPCIDPELSFLRETDDDGNTIRVIHDHQVGELCCVATPLYELMWAPKPDDSSRVDERVVVLVFAGRRSRDLFSNSEGRCSWSQAARLEDAKYLGGLLAATVDWQGSHVPTALFLGHLSTFCDELNAGRVALSPA